MMRNTRLHWLADMGITGGTVAAMAMGTVMSLEAVLLAGGLGCLTLYAKAHYTPTDFHTCYRYRGRETLKEFAEEFEVFVRNNYGQNGEVDGCWQGRIDRMYSITNKLLERNPDGLRRRLNQYWPRLIDYTANRKYAEEERAGKLDRMIERYGGLAP